MQQLLTLLDYTVQRGGVKITMRARPFPKKVTMIIWKSVSMKARPLTHNNLVSYGKTSERGKIITFPLRKMTSIKFSVLYSGLPVGL